MMRRKLGVYICHCGTNIAGVLDCSEMARRASSLPGVAVARHHDYMCSEAGQSLLLRDLHQYGLDGVVVAACSPRMHEATFREVLERGGVNPCGLEIANLREQCSWVHGGGEEAERKAWSLLRAAVARAGRLRPLDERTVPVTPAAMVVGGGIAGIQASLDLAEAGYKVFLVEKGPSIGGRMAQLDKTFPTLDCSACILTPKMVEAAGHPNIELLTMSEVVEARGCVGDFRVKVRTRPRYVRLDACTACGECSRVCGMRKVPSEFEEGLSGRSAVYIPFPQAVPQGALVDPESCLLFTRGKCDRRCLDACLPKAIDFEMEEETRELEVGVVILATGFDLFDPAAMPQYGYGRHPDVLTGLQFERLLSPNGPTGGRVLRHDGSEPRAIAFLHCIGSRDENHHPYCSRICCMYNLKQALLARERTGARVYDFYIDIMAFGKGYQEFYQRAREEGVVFTRGKCSEVLRCGDRLLVLAEDTLLGRPLQVEVDMVVLGTAVEPRRGTAELARMFRVPLGGDGFFLEAHPKLRPVETQSAGIFVVGCCQGPRDIPDSVAQASAGAARALTLLSSGEVRLEAATASVDRESCRGCGLCVQACAYGAISMVEGEGRAEVNPALCRGCGNCASQCLSGALQVANWEDDIILCQIEALAGEGEGR
jgi:heterodisulfide reductase subunit A